MKTQEEDFRSDFKFSIQFSAFFVNKVTNIKANYNL